MSTGQGRGSTAAPRRGVSRAERGLAELWLDLVARLLAEPLTAFPTRPVLEALFASFPGLTGAAAYRATVGADRVPRVRASYWPSTLPGEELTRLGVERMHLHPHVVHAARTGESVTLRFVDIPVAVMSVRDREFFQDLTAPDGLDYQLSIPVETLPGGVRAVEVGRTGEEFTTEDLAVARRLEPLLVGLDRQCAALSGYAGWVAWPQAVEIAQVDVRLTARELAVLALLAEGHTAAAIARRLLIAPATVSKHLERVYTKLGVRDRLTAVLRAQAIGLLPR